jgi:hypothetical protein
MSSTIGRGEENAREPSLSRIEREAMGVVSVIVHQVGCSRYIRIRSKDH